MLGILIQSFQNTNENQRAFAKSLIYLKRNIHFELLPVMFKKIKSGSVSLWMLFPSGKKKEMGAVLGPPGMPLS